ncbi:MAG: OadG family protein [Muribaculaceae bacterium]|nr:OadG family protein [Muribaculaceae bacterium]
MKANAKSIIICALCALTAAFAPDAAAQGRKSLRINEVMVANDSSIVDEFGRRSAWIELVNPTHAPVEISSVYLTDDPQNPTKYYVPRGDAKTRIGKGQQLLFFADGHDNEGPLHLNFTLTPGQDNFIAIYDADGINLIDSVTIPASLAADQSYARTPDGADDWTVRPLNKTTPGSLNDVKGPNMKIKSFETMDPDGFAMAVMAMSIVFGALLVLCLCFMLISNISARSARAAAKAKAEAAEAQAAAQAANADDAAVAAAIALALHSHLNAGVGNARITVNPNPNSAWNAKIMRELPRR